MLSSNKWHGGALQWTYQRLVKQIRFVSTAELETTLTFCFNTYNHHIPQRALNHQTFIPSLQK